MERKFAAAVISSGNVCMCVFVFYILSSKSLFVTFSLPSQKSLPFLEMLKQHSFYFFFFFFFPLTATFKLRLNSSLLGFILNIQGNLGTKSLCFLSDSLLHAMCKSYKSCSVRGVYYFVCFYYNV